MDSKSHVILVKIHFSVRFFPQFCRIGRKREAGRPRGKALEKKAYEIFFILDFFLDFFNKLYVNFFSALLDSPNLKKNIFAVRKFK